MNEVRTGARDAVRAILSAVAAAAVLGASACAPTVKVAPPDEPIVINMNIKIEHEIRVKVDKDLEQLFEEESEIF